MTYFSMTVCSLYLPYFLNTFTYFDLNLGQEEEVEGTISTQPQAKPVIGFKEYFLALNVTNNKRNPWFIGGWLNLKCICL